jgi:multidrug efflux pump subunit AcrA (membrane-fusion protein)
MIRQRYLTYIFLIATLAMTALLVSGCGRSKAQTENANAAVDNSQPKVVSVTTAAAISRDLPRFFEATGSMNGDLQTDVAPTVSGKVISVAVDLGSFVQKGGVLVRLDDRDSRIRLEQSQALYAQQLAAVRQAEEKLGMQPNQKFDPTRVPEVVNAKAALDLADKQLKRNTNLLESGDISRSTYDVAKAQRDQADAAYYTAINAARQNFAGIANARASAAATRTQIDSAQKAINDAVVLSPVGGFVSDRPADVGEYVTTASKIATVVRTNPLRLRIDVPEQAIAQVKPGQMVSISVSTYPDREFTGHVARISPNVTATSRTLTVEAEIDNSEGLLKPGQFASARITQSSTQPAVMVPANAIRTDATNTSRVFVVKNGRAEQHLVQIGQKDGDLLEVKGVNAGDVVATSNLDRLADGIAVTQ